MRTTLAFPLVVLAFAGAAVPAAVEGADGPTAREVEYKQGDVVLKGWMARPQTVAEGGVAGVIVVHDWMGRNEFAKKRAEQLASEGHIAFALDMYGGGKVASGPDEARKLAGAMYEDPALMVARAKAGLDVLRAEPGVVKSRVAAIGFCFGGAVALHLARSGEDFAAVVSFHGGLKTKVPAKEGAVKAKILVLHGGLDPNVPPAEVAAFMDEMNKAKATWRMEIYGGAVHAFTNPDAGDDPSKGAAYDADADRRSKAAQDRFFQEVLSSGR
jgi:dienelactone hydrolase